MVEPFHCRLDEVAPLALFGTEIRVLLPSSALEGGMSMFEDRNGPGVGPPLHVHHDAEEIFHILAGDYRFRCGDALLEGAPGDVTVVPRGTPHTCLNTGSATGRLLVAMRPGGFEGFFQEVAAAGLDVPGDIEEIIRIGARHDIEFLGPNPLADECWSPRHRPGRGREAVGLCRTGVVNHKQRSQRSPNDFSALTPCPHVCRGPGGVSAPAGRLPSAGPCPAADTPADGGLSLP